MLDPIVLPGTARLAPHAHDGVCAETSTTEGPLCCTARVRYSVVGALFGACFPTFACVLLVFLADPATGPRAAWSLWEVLVWAHRTSPLLWIIDTAPLFLGGFAYLAGVRQDRICAFTATLQQQVDAHTETLREALTRLESELAVRQALEAELRQRAMHDPLTGLANRELLRDRLAHALERAARSGTTDVAVLFLDLDDFKRVNDSLGHSAGDALLVQVAERLRSATRGSDTVARTGGDEFAVVLEDVHARQGAVVVAERIEAALRTPFHVADQTIRVGTSTGITIPSPGENECEVLRNADVAMYEAKQRGKGGYVMFDSSMHVEVLERLTLEASLRAAVDAPTPSGLWLAYQPVVALDTGVPVGIEALVRWKHPERGALSPAAFIPVAESTGLIVPLGRWVLREACRQAAEWRRDPAIGVDPDAGDGLYMSVNLSGRQLQDSALIEDVTAALHDAGLPPSALLLEITESVIMQDNERNLATLHALKALGVRLAIDDFGTGHSSLRYLQQFPVDVLKIDKSFVAGAASEAHDEAIARTVVALGTTLGLRTVAEGIETEEQRVKLHVLGSEFGQGYHFARPLPPEEAAVFLSAALVE